MIAAVKFRTTENAAGRVYDQAQIWIGGIPFSADLQPHVERVVRRIAKEAGCEVQDTRKPTHTTA